MDYFDFLRITLNYQELLRRHFDDVMVMTMTVKTVRIMLLAKTTDDAYICRFAKHPMPAGILSVYTNAPL